MIGMLNRSAVVVRPLQPYLDWAKLDDSTGVAESVFETLRATPNVYLIPENEDGEDLNDMARSAWPAFFEEMLSAWLTDPEMWPRNRTWEMFNEWFEVQVCESVFDLVSGAPLEVID